MGDLAECARKRAVIKCRGRPLCLPKGENFRSPTGQPQGVAPTKPTVIQDERKKRAIKAAGLNRDGMNLLECQKIIIAADDTVNISRNSAFQKLVIIGIP